MFKHKPMIIAIVLSWIIGFICGYQFYDYHQKRQIQAAISKASDSLNDFFDYGIDNKKSGRRE